jgi:hypothetical protein
VNPQCPHCRKSTVSYLLLLRTFFQSRHRVDRIECPSCGGYACLSRQSMGVWLLLVVLFPIPILAALAKLRWGLLRSAGPYSGGVFYVFWMLAWASVWPWIVKFQSWDHYVHSGWKPWLPKSRIVGYSVYLLLPIIFMVMLFALAVHEGWGM